MIGYKYDKFRKLIIIYFIDFIIYICIYMYIIRRDYMQLLCRKNKYEFVSFVDRDFCGYINNLWISKYIYMRVFLGLVDKCIKCVK